MPPSEKAIWRIKEILRTNFGGRFTVAEDLMKIPARASAERKNPGKNKR
jgi:hypothetical protein